MLGTLPTVHCSLERSFLCPWKLTIKGSLQTIALLSAEEIGFLGSKIHVLPLHLGRVLRLHATQALRRLQNLDSERVRLKRRLAHNEQLFSTHMPSKRSSNNPMVLPSPYRLTIPKPSASIMCAKKMVKSSLQAIDDRERPMYELSADMLKAGENADLENDGAALGRKDVAPIWNKASDVTDETMLGALSCSGRMRLSGSRSNCVLHSARIGIVVARARDSHDNQKRPEAAQNGIRLVCLSTRGVIY